MDNSKIIQDLPNQSGGGAINWAIFLLAVAGTSTPLLPCDAIACAEYSPCFIPPSAPQPPPPTARYAPSASEPSLAAPKSTINFVNSTAGPVQTGIIANARLGPVSQVAGTAFSATNVVNDPGVRSPTAFWSITSKLSSVLVQGALLTQGVPPPVAFLAGVGTSHAVLQIPPTWKTFQSRTVESIGEFEGGLFRMINTPNFGRGEE